MKGLWLRIRDNAWGQLCHSTSVGSAVRTLGTTQIDKYERLQGNSYQYQYGGNHLEERESRLTTAFKPACEDLDISVILQDSLNELT